MERFIFSAYLQYILYMHTQMQKDRFHSEGQTAFFLFKKRN